MDIVDDDETQTRPAERSKPIIPRTVGGAAMVAIPLSAIIGLFSWTGERILSHDEQITRLSAETISQEHRLQEGTKLLNEVRIRQERLLVLMEDLKMEQNLLRGIATGKSSSETDP